MHKSSQHRKDQALERVAIDVHVGLGLQSLAVSHCCFLICYILSGIGTTSTPNKRVVLYISTEKRKGKRT